MNLVQFKRGRNLKVLEMARSMFLQEKGEVVDYYESNVVCDTRIPKELVPEEDLFCAFTNTALYRDDGSGYLTPKKQMRFHCLSGAIFQTIYKLVNAQRELGYSDESPSSLSFDQTVFDGDLFRLFGLKHREDDPHWMERRDKIQHRWDKVVLPFLIFWRFVPISKDNLVMFLAELDVVEREFIEPMLLSLHPQGVWPSVRAIFVSKIMELTGVKL